MKYEHLPPPPQIDIIVETKEDIGTGFLSVVRRKARFRRFKPDHPNDAPVVSDLTTIDVVKRSKQNAVAIIPYMAINEEFLIYLRSSIRPAIAFKNSDSGDGNLWELPAGLIEPDENPTTTAQRELFEEMGIFQDEANFAQMGPPIYPTVGICGEIVTFFVVDVTSSKHYIPSLDGSPMEEGAAIYPATITQLKLAMDAGELMDSKTEIGIRRFIEWQNI